MRVSRYWLADKPDDEKRPIYARSGWEIPQERLDLMHIKLLQVDLVRNRANEDHKQHPNAKLRSVSAFPYNCVGLAFASRRTVISIDHIYDILKEDGYHPIQLSECVVGDMVLYKWEGELAHVGVIIHIISERPVSIRVLSRWGFDGEFEHFIKDVPPTYGEPVEFFTERVL